ncbi:MAG: hypothetical protein WBO97_11360 [Tepidiformaceae bacterium]
MGALTDLHLNTTDGPITCVAAPDSVLAEASAMKPRPSFAPNLLTAEPTARLLWWPERQHLEPHTFTRLKWLIETAGGETWLVLDSEEPESPAAAELASGLASAGLAAGEAIKLGRTEFAVSVRIAGRS